jgi:glycosyltransferase involved in cell wall biosynthesis
VSLSLGERMQASGWPGRFHVVPNVVDTERFALGAPTRDGLARIVTVASLDPVKGVGDLIEAARILAQRHAGFRVDVVGDGSLRGELAARIRELDLTEQVVLHGTLPPEEVAALMRSAAFAVVPSLWETFSVVLSEAMACGLPVVATAVGALPERVHAGNGLLVEPRDPDALAEAMARMLERHDAYDRAAIAAEARERYSPTAGAKRWGAVYEEVVQRRADERRRS